MVRFSETRLETIFANFKNKRILVVGDVMVDEYLRGTVNRLSPEAPVPIVEIDQESYHFGGAANVSYNLKTLGCEPITIGLIGNDRAGRILLELLKEKDLSVDGIVQTEDRPTTLKTRIIGDNQHIARVDRERVAYIEGSLLDEVKDKFDVLLDTVEAIILEDYNKGILSKGLIKHVQQKALQKGIMVLVDPKFVNFLEYRDVTLFKPNIKETVHALGRPIQTDQEVSAAGMDLLRMLNAQNVLITRGGKGMSLIEKSGQVHHIPTRTRTVADVSGAGDTVISALTAAMVGGATVQEAATIANFAAGLVCEEVGIVPIQRHRLLNVLKEEQLEHA